MLQCNGIYDVEFWKFLNNLSEVSAIGIDFNPKSFNFLQEYKFLEWLELAYDDRKELVLHFANEKNFVIEKIIGDARKIIEQRAHNAFPMNRVLLSFQELSPDLRSYDQFELGYYVEFDYEIPVESYQQTEFLRGIIFDFSMLEIIHNSAEWDKFAIWLKDHLFPLATQRRWKILLKSSWKANLFPSLFSLFKFDRIVLTIDSEVEKGYRQVNRDLVQQHFKSLLQELKG